MRRRSFLSATSAALLARQSSTGARQTASPGQERFDLEEADLRHLQELMTGNSASAERITEQYLARIAAIDQAGPKLKAVIEVNPEALATARALDKERTAKGPRGPLHGIPVLLKDNIDTGDRMQTTAGSLALAGKPAGQDAFLVARLRAAGAVILGKTNLSEWANFRSTHSTSGWSGRSGQTKNPYALDRNPCGSSSGSGAAVSANLAAVAVGTETDGSVVCPSSVCGIVGIKPTLGLISRSGIVPISHSQDTAGPMARTVRDAAILLGVMAGVDANDPATAASAGHVFTDYTQFLKPDGLKGKRIGICRQYFNIGPAITKSMEDAIAALKSGGAEVFDPVEFDKFESWRETETEVLLYEFKSDLNSYLAKRDAQVKSLADCIAFNKQHRAEEMPFFQQELMEQAQEKGPLTDKEYQNALKTNLRLTRKEGTDKLLEKHRLDALAGPTAGPAWVTDLVAGDHVDGGCASPPAVAGYPHITIPAGSYFGLPIGFSLFASAWSEPKLLAMAYALEQILKARRKPQLRFTVDLGA